MLNNNYPSSNFTLWQCLTHQRSIFFLYILFSSAYICTNKSMGINIPNVQRQGVIWNQNSICSFLRKCFYIKQKFSLLEYSEQNLYFAQWLQVITSIKINYCIVFSYVDAFRVYASWQKNFSLYYVFLGYLPLGLCVFFPVDFSLLFLSIRLCNLDPATVPLSS